jgi:hypothetical protein
MPASDLNTRSSLIERLRDREDKETWRDFFTRYWKPVYGLALNARKWPVEDLRRVAQVFSGRMIGVTGGLLPARAEVLKQYLRRLKLRHPVYFQP